MPSIQCLLNLDWDDIGRSILQHAARQIADAARRRINAPDGTMTVKQTAPDLVRLSIRSADLISREQGTSAAPAQPFLAPIGQDRADLRQSLIVELRKIIV